MQAALIAFGRALRSLARPGVLWHVLWPALASGLLWGLLAWFFWQDAAAWLAGALGAATPEPGAAQAGGWLAGLATAGAHLLLGVLLLGLLYLTALLLVAAIALPLMLERVAASEYADLAQHRGGSLGGSALNAAWAALVFVLGLVLSLPLWLIPGAGPVLLVLLTAYLNQRAYRIDASMLHADAREMRALARRERGGLWVTGIGTALLAWVPVVNLFAPALAGLTFVHYCLQALRRLRAQSGG
jgi:uncharacterized protein involved in cysteine biosynthesis